MYHNQDVCRSLGYLGHQAFGAMADQDGVREARESDAWSKKSVTMVMTTT